MAEHPAVNRRVVSSSLTCGANLESRSLETSSGDLSLRPTVFATARMSYGWSDVAVNVRSFQVKFEHTESSFRFSLDLF